jgi:hypothetical protein
MSWKNQASVQKCVFSFDENYIYDINESLEVGAKS